MLPGIVYMVIGLVGGAARAPRQCLAVAALVAAGSLAPSVPGMFERLDLFAALALAVLMTSALNALIGYAVGWLARAAYDKLAAR